MVYIWFYLRSLSNLRPLGRMWGICLYAKADYTSQNTFVCLFAIDDLHFTIMSQGEDLFYLYFWALEMHFKSDNLDVLQFEKFSAIISFNIYLPILLFFISGTLVDT